MKKVFTSLLLGLFLVLTLALSACANDKNGTYYPSNEEMKINLENDSYFVESYHDDYAFDGENGDVIRWSADTIRAKKGAEYIQFCRVNMSEACDYYYNKLRKAYPDAEVFILIENDKSFGNIVYCGTENAVNAAGIKVINVKVKA